MTQSTTETKQSPLEKFISTVEEWLALLGAAAFFLMMLLVTTDVSLRYFFNSPIAGQNEIVELFMIIGVYLAISFTQREGAHVGVELFVEKLFKGLSAKVNHILILLLSLFVNVLIVIYTFDYAVTTYHNGRVSLYLQWPVWFIPLFATLGTLILCIRLVLEMKEVAKES